MGVTEADLLEEMDLPSVECLNQVRACLGSLPLDLGFTAAREILTAFAPLPLSTNRPRARTGATP